MARMLQEVGPVQGSTAGSRAGAGQAAARGSNQPLVQLPGRCEPHVRAPGSRAQAHGFGGGCRPAVCVLQAQGNRRPCSPAGATAGVHQCCALKLQQAGCMPEVCSSAQYRPCREGRMLTMLRVELDSWLAMVHGAGRVWKSGAVAAAADGRAAPSCLHDHHACCRWQATEHACSEALQCTN